MRYRATVTEIRTYMWYCTVHYFSVTCVVHIHVLSAVSNVQLYALQKYEINVPIVEVYMYM